MAALQLFPLVAKPGEKWGTRQTLASLRRRLLRGVVSGILSPIMSTHTFALLFDWNPKDELAPLDADAQIVLKDRIAFKGRDGRIAITNLCATVRELEVQVDRLHRELEEVLNAGRQKFHDRDRYRESA